MNRAPIRQAIRGFVSTRTIWWGSATWVLPLVLLAGLALFLSNSASWASFLSEPEAWYRAHTPLQVQRLMYLAKEAYLSPWNWLVVLGTFVVERIIPVDRKQRAFSMGLAQDFVWFNVTGIVLLVIIPAYLGLLKFFYDHYLSMLTIHATAVWPMAWRVVLSVFLLDFFSWVHHYIRHKVELFWYFHMTHHSQTQLNIFTENRFHVVEYLLAVTVTFPPTFMLGLGLGEIVWLAFVTYWYTRVYHANLRTNYGFLKHFMVTPQSHRIHHSIEERHWNKNFGVLFTIWDRMFGTLYTNYDEYPATGIPYSRYPLECNAGLLSLARTWVKQCVYPFKLSLQLAEKGRAR